MALTMKHSETATHTISKLMRCKPCGTVTKVTRAARWYYGWEQVLREDGQWVDANTNAARIACRACNIVGSKGSVIRATHTDQECNDKCMSATGPVCECSCDGANHGGSHS